MTEEGVKSARVAIAIVELLARHEDLGVSEIARATGTTKARVFRHLRTLLALGYAVQKPGSDRYARGPRLVALARVLGLSAEDGLIELARPVMQRLQQQFPHSFNLSLVHGEQVSIVESLPGKALIGITVRLNQPIPLHATAAGKLFLADRLAHGASLPRKLASFTDATIADAAALRTELERIAARGWADAPEQSVLGINAVSAPIHDHRGELTAMISAMDSIQVIPAGPPERLVAALRAAAGEIAQRIGLQESDMTPAERIEEIAVLRQNAIDYWYRVDHEGGAGVSEMFVEDGVFHAGPGDPLVGRAAIEAFYAWRRDRGARTSRHIVTNFHAEFDGERTVRTTCIMVLYGTDGAPPHEGTSAAMIADLIDDCVKGEDGEWRYARRNFAPLYIGEAELTVAPEKLMGPRGKDASSA